MLPRPNTWPPESRGTKKMSEQVLLSYLIYYCLRLCCVLYIQLLLPGCPSDTFKENPVCTNFGIMCHRSLSTDLVQTNFHYRNTHAAEESTSLCIFYGRLTSVRNVINPTFSLVQPEHHLKASSKIPTLRNLTWEILDAWPKRSKAGQLLAQRAPENELPLCGQMAKRAPVSS